ncbi:hypothetical protein B0T14DRAFT_572114 [Immersiella caudata]|uniref:Uncharacterized protein n=1 Tax=Immersiella caudata TaxID=314043 RepID=A0AA39WA36_9PEZI|nr:hypothetical protein B0T14DRAFT_572114 [Immersiella caudata]
MEGKGKNKEEIIPAAEPAQLAVAGPAQPVQPEAANNAPKPQSTPVEPPGWAVRYASMPNPGLHRAATRFYAIIRRFSLWDDTIEDYVIDMTIECAVLNHPVLQVNDNVPLQAKIQQIHLFARHLLDHGITASEVYNIVDHAMMGSAMPDLDFTDRPFRLIVATSGLQEISSSVGSQADPASTCPTLESMPTGILSKFCTFLTWRDMWSLEDNDLLDIHNLRLVSRKVGAVADTEAFKKFAFSVREHSFQRLLQVAQRRGQHITPAATR